MNELEEIAVNFQSDSLQSQARSASNGPSSKKAKFMNGIGDAELVDDVSSLFDAKEEVARYQLEKTISATANPLLWWKRNRDISSDESSSAEIFVYPSNFHNSREIF